MADIAVLALAAVFFALCWAYIRGCERMITPGQKPGGGGKP